jgi:hypothetical protein
MKRTAVLFFACFCILAQHRESGANSTATVTNPPGVRDIERGGDADLGDRIRSAVATLGPGGGVIRIRAGVYTWKTTAIIDPRKVSLHGEGAALVSINCMADRCLVLNEPTYSLDQGGSIGGFTLRGNGKSSQIGVEAGGVIGEQFEDIVFTGFSGDNAVGLLFNNSAAGNGWMERTVARRIRFDGNSKGWEFKYNTRNPPAGSFGYSNIEAQCDTVVKGQSCIVVTGGALYHSRIEIFGNVDVGGTLISVPGATSGIDELFGNVYQVFAEGSGTGLVVGKGAQFTGYGVVDLGGMPVLNANPPSYAGRVRVLQGPTEVGSGDGGSIPNFLGSGNTAQTYPILVRDMGTPTPGFGLMEGPNISSTYVSVYGGAPNAFEVLACPFKPRDMGQCPVVARVDSSGNVRASGAFFAGGSDYAESVSTVVAGAHYEPGDVLTIDANLASRFTVSGTPYSTSVAGVYSTKPGLLGSTHPLTEAGAAEIPLAIHGIVPCKVSAENGPVRPGDLLVSAATAGYAMKGTDRNRMLGAVLGKSLAAVDHGTAIVPILVTLQ